MQVFFGSKKAAWRTAISFDIIQRKRIFRKKTIGSSVAFLPLPFKCHLFNFVSRYISK